jgi:hypothetical protein
MKTWQWLGIGGLTVAAGIALAQPRTIDRDGDGAVTLEEFEAARLEAVREQFRRLDADSDGRLTREELQARREQFAGRHGRDRPNIDTDGDGAWSLPELQAVRPGLTVEQFNRLDRNGDGLIGADERPMRGRPPMRGPREPGNDVN